MSTVFDHIASQYDTDFTQSAIGKLQRQHVWEYLNTQVLPQLTHGHPLQILELNCGTGEDACTFAEQGHLVWATDIAPKMVATSKQKAKNRGVERRVTARTLPIQQISQLKIDNKFDLIFSNFGGLNCLTTEELGQLALDAAQLLRKNGRFVGIIMSSFCLWEIVYFLAKLDVNQAFRRRNKQGVWANVGNGQQIQTWYYSPRTIKKIFQTPQLFAAQKVTSIGLAVPPSYLEGFFSRRSNSLQLLNRIDKIFNNIAPFANFADHYLIDLAKC